MDNKKKKGPSTARGGPLRKREKARKKKGEGTFEKVLKKNRKKKRERLYPGVHEHRKDGKR